ncbi:MAG TPA: hypothetical protein VNO70_11520, partial [Blastocatellia bacterium]|nr:hypothetical protein [Blastocatellia bacterium]
MSAWSVTAARLSTTTGSTAVEANAAASFDPASPAGSVVVLDAAPNYSLEALPGLGLTAGAAMPPPSADLDQVRNGSAAAPINPADWVNGNAGPSNAHYAEGYSIPYRIKLFNLAVGPHVVEIEWDIRHSSKAALDYITHFERINNPSHLGAFGHVAEDIDPTIGVAGVSAAVFNTFAIPAPSSAGSTVAGQPTTSFNALPAAERVMTIYNGAITSLSYVSQGSLTASQSSTRLRIEFNAADPTVVLAWGGHIASQADWGAGNSASSVSGSPYHTRIISLDGSGGNQDRSLKAAAVIVPCGTCEVSGPGSISCPGSAAQTYTAPITGICDNPQYSWSFGTNTSGATFAGGTTGSSVQVNPGNACGSFVLQVAITCTGCSNGTQLMCSKTVNVVDTTPPVITCPPNRTLECPADTSPATTGVATATDNCDATPTVTFADAVVNGCGNTRTITRTWTATDDCGNSSSCVQTIAVVDTTDPVLTGCPADASVQCLTDVPAAPTVTANDACDGPLTVSFTETQSNPGSSCDNVITRTWTATDACGNSASCTQRITVDDTTPPEITCPPDITVNACGAEVVPAPDFTGGSATDNCGTPTVTSSDAGECPRIVRTWTATDSCGNTASCEQIITFELLPAAALTLTADLLRAGDLVVGVPGTRSLTIPGGRSANSSARCLVSRLAAGGPAGALPDFGDARLNPSTCQARGAELRNALLSQAVSLALNLRLSSQQQLKRQLQASGAAALLQVGRPDAEFDLSGFVLTSAFWTQAALPGPDGALGTFDDELDVSSARTQF